MAFSFTSQVKPGQRRAGKGQEQEGKAQGRREASSREEGRAGRAGRAGQGGARAGQAGQGRAGGSLFAGGPKLPTIF